MFQMLDKDGVILYVNDKWLEDTGYTKDEVIGKSFKSFILEEDYAVVEKKFPILKDYGFVNDVLLKVKRKDGVVIEEVLNGISVYDENGEFLNTRCELKNISYFMKSNQYIQGLLEEEIFLKKSLHMKSQINNALIFSENLNDFLNSILLVLSELTEILNVSILKFNLNGSISIKSSSCMDGFMESVIKETLIKNDFIENIPNDFFIVKKDENIQGFEKLQKFLKNGDAFVILTVIPESKIESKKIIFFLHLHKDKMGIFKDKWINLLKEVRELFFLGLNTFEMYENTQIMIDKLSNVPIGDNLSVTYKKNEFEDAVYREIERRNRYSTSFSIVVFSINNLKQLNDSIGEFWVEEILRKLSREINRSIRGLDQFFRLDIDKFAILLPESKEKEAVKISQRIKDIILNFENETEKLTSIFGTTEGRKNDTLDSVYERVNKILYKSKDKNGNIVFIC